MVLYLSAGFCNALFYGVLSPCTTYTTADKGPIVLLSSSFYLFLFLFLHFFRDKHNKIEGVADRLEIGREESLTNWFGNPCPGVLKTLRIRYVSLEGVARGSRREVWLQETEVRRPRGAVLLSWRLIFRKQHTRYSI